MKRKNEHALIQLSTVATIISIVWSFTRVYFDNTNIFFKVLMIIVFGLGGIGLYIPVGYSIKCVFEKLYGDENAI